MKRLLIFIFFSVFSVPYFSVFSHELGSGSFGKSAIGKGVEAIEDSIGAEWNPTGNPIGGGPGYSDSVRQQDANYVVTTKAELQNAINSAGSGDIIYIVDSVEIDVSSTSYNMVPSGVTIASGRGTIKGDTISWGALIYLDDPGTGSRTTIFSCNSRVRITGLRLRGSYDAWYQNRDISKAYKHSNQTGDNEQAISINDRDSVEVDNCEMWGFSYYCVYVGGDTLTEEFGNSIHHCTMEHTNWVYYGYGGVGLNQKCGNVEIYGNYGNNMAHFSQNSAWCYFPDGGGKPLLTYNIYGYNSTSCFHDCHNSDGTHKMDSTGSVDAKNNTIRFDPDYRYYGGQPHGVLVDQQWIPSIAHVHHNWFFDDSSKSIAYDCVPESIDIHHNHYDSLPPPGVSDLLPSCTIVADSDTCHIGTTIHFDQTGFSGKADPFSYSRWCFGDSAGSSNHYRSTDTTETVSHQYNEPGRYLVEVCVIDKKGRRNWDWHTITVLPTDGKKYLSCWVTDRFYDSPTGYIYRQILIRKKGGSTYDTIYNQDMSKDGGWEHVVLDITDSLDAWKSAGADSMDLFFRMYVKRDSNAYTTEQPHASAKVFVDDVSCNGADVKNGNIEAGVWYHYGSNYMRTDDTWIPVRSLSGSIWRAYDYYGNVRTGKRCLEMGHFYSDWNQWFSEGDYAGYTQRVKID